MSVISGLSREVSENRAVLFYYVASGGNFLQTFRYNLSVPHSRFKKRNSLDVGADRFSRKVP